MKFKWNECRWGDGLWHLYRLCHLCQSNERINHFGEYKKLNNSIKLRATQGLLSLEIGEAIAEMQPKVDNRSEKRDRENGNERCIECKTTHYVNTYRDTHTHTHKRLRIDFALVLAL